MSTPVPSGDRKPTQNTDATTSDPLPANRFQHAAGVTSAIIFTGFACWLQWDTGGPAYMGRGLAQGLALLFIGLPLLVIHLSIWFYYVIRKPASRWVHIIMSVPLIVSVLLSPIQDLIATHQAGVEYQKNPVVQEVHVNLTGRDMLPDNVGIAVNDRRHMMPGETPETFREFSRYPTILGYGRTPGQFMGYEWLYENGRLSPNATTIARDYDDNTTHNIHDTEADVHVPLIVSATEEQLQAPPQLAREISGLSDYIYIYFHYPQHTEVARILSLSGMQSAQLEGKDSDVIKVAVFALAGAPIARIQINGQEVGLGGFNAPVAPTHPAFDHWCRTGGMYTIASIPGRLTVRWHTTEPPFTWQQASVDVPAFSDEQHSPNRVLSNEIELYIGEYNQLHVSRVQWLQQDSSKDSRRQIRATVLAGISHPCATADQWADLDHVDVINPYM